MIPDTWLRFYFSFPSKMVYMYEDTQIPSGSRTLKVKKSINKVVRVHKDLLLVTDLMQLLVNIVIKLAIVFIDKLVFMTQFIYRLLITISYMLCYVMNTLP